MEAALMLSLEEKLIGVLMVLLVIAGCLLAARHEGVVSCENKETAAATKQTVTVTKQEGTAAVNEAAGRETHANEVAAPTLPAPVVQLCPAPKAAHPGRVLRPAGPGPSTDAAVDSPAGPAQLPAVEWNTEPILQIGRDADARIKYLQGYIRDRCKAPQVAR